MKTDKPVQTMKPAHGALYTAAESLALYKALLAAGQTELAAKLAEKCNGFADKKTRKRIAVYIENVNADNDGDVECDGADGSAVSLGDDSGAYVMCWRWAPNCDAGLPDTEEETAK